MSKSKVQKLQSELEYWRKRALTDKLTGLRNREALEEDLSEMAEARYLMIDVDDFKEYNDTHGHEAGDQVLRDVADALKDVAESYDVTAYRFGGEEFLLAGSIITKDTGCAAVNEVRENTDVTCSVGLGSTVSEADQALYSAKNSGKNCLRTV